jgi:hypothetical protein
MGEVNLPLAAVRAQLRSALDLIVQVARGADGERRVVAVAEVAVAEAGQVETGMAIEADAPVDVRLLVGADGVLALPTRPARSARAPQPDPSWVSP